MGISLRKALYNINNKRYKSGFIKLSAIPAGNHTTLDDGVIMSINNSTRLNRGTSLSLLGSVTTDSNSNRRYFMKMVRYRLLGNRSNIRSKYVINRHASRKLLLSLSYITETLYDDFD